MKDRRECTAHIGRTREALSAIEITKNQVKEKVKKSKNDDKSVRFRTLYSDNPSYCEKAELQASYGDVVATIGKSSKGSERVKNMRFAKALFWAAKEEFAKQPSGKKKLKDVRKGRSKYSRKNGWV